VLKIGSSSVSSGDKNVNLCVISGLVETIMKLRKLNYNVILVTSGAVSIGCARMRLGERPKDLIARQAIAAIGQSRLMRLYDDFFSLVEQPIAQVLLTRENLSKSNHYQNAFNTLKELFRLGVVPIINENDTVAVEELRVGDNDTLSALVASLVQADWLFLLTDVDALYDKDPTKNTDAKPIHMVPNVEELTVQIGSPGDWGIGGMSTKIQAARIATAAGVRTVITKSAQPENILKIIKGHDPNIGTQFLPQAKPLAGRKRWIAHGFVPSGKLFLDPGAVQAVKQHKSLFGPGIVSVEGNFSAHLNVALYDNNGHEFARGLVNYNAEQLQKIKGKCSREYITILGYIADDEVINRDNLALL